eukprot:Colp12_sorted_trinity150504_noHs@23208
MAASNMMLGVATVLVLLCTSFALPIGEVNASVSSTSQFTDCNAKVLVDGMEYFEELAKELEGATKEILITGWKIHPEVILSGRGTENNSTLLQILQRAVSRNVKVYVLFWASDSSEPLGKDLNGYRVKEGVAQLRAVGVECLVDRGRGLLPVLRWS